MIQTSVPERIHHGDDTLLGLLTGRLRARRFARNNSLNVSSRVAFKVYS